MYGVSEYVLTYGKGERKKRAKVRSRLRPSIDMLRASTRALRRLELFSLKTDKDRSGTKRARDFT